MEVDPRAAALDDERAERAIELDRRERIGLERAARGDPERSERPAFEQLADHVLHRLDRRRHAVREGDAGHAAHAREAVAHGPDRKSTRLNSSHEWTPDAVF